jgi:hypothetical protein
MSLEVLLIPLGIAAYTLLKEARSSDLCEKCRATRVIDPELLRAALLRMGASIVDDTDQRIRATGRWGDLTFQKVGDLFLGRVDGGTEAATEAMLTELDQHVGRVVQARTAALVMERAQELGFRLIEQQDDDGTLNYVFEEIA